ncbi:unnamed protein product [Closterium sp. NIES-65]|nr:unnamed protein product [Closterium sp. NIES-65]
MRPVSESTRISVTARLEEFRDGTEPEMTFEADLSNHDRAVVHELCRKMGFVSRSRGRAAAGDTPAGPQPTLSSSLPCQITARRQQLLIMAYQEEITRAMEHHQVVLIPPDHSKAAAAADNGVSGGDNAGNGASPGGADCGGDGVWQDHPDHTEAAVITHHGISGGDNAGDRAAPSGADSGGDGVRQDHPGAAVYSRPRVGEGQALPRALHPTQTNLRYFWWVVGGSDSGGADSGGDGVWQDHTCAAVYSRPRVGEGQALPCALHPTQTNFGYFWWVVGGSTCTTQTPEQHTHSPVVVGLVTFETPQKSASTTLTCGSWPGAAGHSGSRMGAGETLPRALLHPTQTNLRYFSGREDSSGERGEDRSNSGVSDPAGVEGQPLLVPLALHQRRAAALPRGIVWPLPSHLHSLLAPPTPFPLFPSRAFPFHPTVAERIAAERGEGIGKTVGYQIRLESKGNRSSSLWLCTNGVLLRCLVGLSGLFPPTCTPCSPLQRLSLSFLPVPSPFTPQWPRG